MAGRFETRAAGRRRRPARRPSYPRVPSRGTLLPAQESDTTCYARTHKGNTKTLTKGNASWWMLD